MRAQAQSRWNVGAYNYVRGGAQSRWNVRAHNHNYVWDGAGTGARAEARAEAEAAGKKCTVGVYVCLDWALAQDDCSRAADPLEDKRRCRRHMMCGQWTSALQRESGMCPAVAAAATVVVSS